MNRDGKSTYIQLAISSKNISDEYRLLCDKINQYYPAKRNNDNWVWRVPFKSKTVEIDKSLNKEKIKENLDSCFMEILTFEKDLRNKLIN